MLVMSYLYLMVAITRTDLLAHLANIVSRKKFRYKEDFLAYICDKRIWFFPAGELVSCSICLSAWIGCAWAAANGVVPWFSTGLSYAFIWHITDTILSRVEK